ncbi:MAG: ClbS/DfsB family four-helix bundle protein [Bifidobacterium sp.]|jgi:hypothetical protein|nr:ClbS/DfsB family four-helix bundle protein [Bifidobacterium sp.]
MAVPATKEDLLAAIEKTFAQLEDDLDRVPIEATRNRVLEGHVKDTVMSPSDLVAYLVGWNQQVLTWHRRRDEELPDEFPAAGIKWNELGLLAQRYYAEHSEDSWHALRWQLRNAKKEIIALVERHSDAELYGSPWYGKWTMGRMISFNTASPYANARRRVRSWLRGVQSEVA